MGARRDDGQAGVCKSAVKKIESYQTNHIYMGDRLIITFETEQCPLNFRIVENLIEKYLM